MQSSVLDILVYLFDYLVYEKKERPSIEDMQDELNSAGFSQKDIDRAMSWLLDLNDLQESEVLKSPSDSALRIFTTDEIAKLSGPARGFLFELTNMGVIDARLREILIQKLMSLDEDIISIDEVKWVALMAIFNRPGQEANTIWLEQSLLSEASLRAVN
ncbi:MAG: DUF494 domain-containing protein [Gammaproteobacteria bacterium]|nr:DUF494 domain-containing protein [Gammaproteobacteria bacterium]